MEQQTEADALSEQFDGEEGWEMTSEEEREEAHADFVYIALSQYQRNAKAKVKSKINCASCGRRMVKKSYQSQFCSNKGRGNCKDAYWNNVDNERHERTRYYNR